MSRKIIIASAVIILLLSILAMQAFALELSFWGNKRWLYNETKVLPQSQYINAMQDNLLHYGTPWTEPLDLFIEYKHSADLKLNYSLKQLPLFADMHRVEINDFIFIGTYPYEIYKSGSDLLLQDKPSGVDLGVKLGNFEMSYFAGGYSQEQLAGDYKNTRYFRSPEYKGEKVAYSINRDDPYSELWGIELGASSDQFEVEIDGRKIKEGLDYYYDAAECLLLLSSNNLEGKELKVKYGASHKEKTFNLKNSARRRAFIFKDFRLIDGSETVWVDDRKLIRDIDYRMNYSTGLLVLNCPINEDAEVKIGYDFTYGSNYYLSEQINNQTGTDFNLSAKNLVEKSETVEKNGVPLNYGLDYTMDYRNGRITFNTSLRRMDSVEISYSYTGPAREMTGAMVEYKLGELGKIGVSQVKLTTSNSDSWLASQFFQTSVDINSVYGQFIPWPESYVRAELASSRLNANYSGSWYVDMDDTALKVFGRSKIGGLEVLANYRKVGLGFATCQYIRTLTGSRDDSTDLVVKYKVNNNLTIRSGIGEGIMESSADFREIKLSKLNGGVIYSIGAFDMGFDFNRYDQSSSSGEALTEQIAGNLSLDVKSALPFISSSFDKSRFLLKHLNSHEYNRTTLLGADTLLSQYVSQYEIGWLGRLNCGLSAYFNYKSEFEKDVYMGVSIVRLEPFYRLAYNFIIGPGQNIEVYYDLLTQRYAGGLSSNKNTSSFGVLWRMLVDNPVLRQVQFGSAVKTIVYEEFLNPDNSYAANEYGFDGSFIF